MHVAHESLAEHHAEDCEAKALLPSKPSCRLTALFFLTASCRAQQAGARRARERRVLVFQSELETLTSQPQQGVPGRPNWGDRNRARQGVPGSCSQDLAPPLHPQVHSMEGSVSTKDVYKPQRILESAAKSLWTPWEAFWDTGGPPHQQVALSELS